MPITPISKEPVIPSYIGESVGGVTEALRRSVARHSIRRAGVPCLTSSWAAGLQWPMRKSDWSCLAHWERFRAPQLFHLSRSALFMTPAWPGQARKAKFRWRGQKDSQQRGWISVLQHPRVRRGTDQLRAASQPASARQRMGIYVATRLVIAGQPLHAQTCSSAHPEPGIDCPYTAG